MLFVDRGAGDKPPGIVCQWLQQNQGRRQLAIFPEGSNTNGKALLPFRPGAFKPASPVQPVLIKYRNKYDTLTWTWKSNAHPFTLFILTLCMPYTRASLTFLPIYRPTEVEASSPITYANNVSNHMANHLQVGVSKFMKKKWIEAIESGQMVPTEN